MIAKDVVLHVEGISIRGRLYLPAGKASFPAVCVCHGIPARLPAPGDRGYPFLAERICQEGFAVLIFNFRGAGGSGGNLDILGWTRDLKAVIDYLCRLVELGKSRLSLLGFSAGAAVSIYVAAQEKRVCCVAACACPEEFTFITGADEPQAILDRFRGIGVIRDENFPQSIEEWFNGFRLVRPIEYVAGIAPRPLLLVHGSKDERVDISHARKLYARAQEPKQLVVVDGGGHKLRLDDRAVNVVIDWLKSRCF